MCDQKKSRLPDDEIAELLIQTERGECQKKMRTISLDGCHLLFEVYLKKKQEKNICSYYETVLRNSTGNCFEESLGGKVV